MVIVMFLWRMSFCSSMSVTLPDCTNQEAKACRMVCRVAAYRLSPSSGARLSFLTAVWKQAGVFSRLCYSFRLTFTVTYCIHRL